MLQIVDCDDASLYQNSVLNSSINLLLDLPQVQNRAQGGEYDSAYGEVLTSVGNEWSDLITMPGTTGLIQWITKELLKLNPDAKSLKYSKSWCNKMFKGSEGLVHAHTYPMFGDRKPDFVAIFYVQAETDCANLVFVDGGIFNSHYYDYDESKITTVYSRTGRLVIHSPNIPHAVTIHNSDIPRICLVFEGNYIV